MSAYALNFFPSFASSGTLIPSTKVHPNMIPSSNEKSHTFTSSDSDSDSNPPKPLSSSSSSSSKTINSNNENEPNAYNTSDLLITIQSVTIDHIRLIQSLALRRGSFFNSTVATEDVCKRRNSDTSLLSIGGEVAGRRESITRRASRKLSASFTGFPGFSDSSSEQWGEYDDSSPTSSENTNYFHLLSDEPTTDANYPAVFTFENLSESLEECSGSSSSASNVDFEQFCNHTDYDGYSAGPSGYYPETQLTNKSVDVNAFQFNISICWNRRTYNFTRTFPSFVKLRDDLIKELSTCKQNASGKIAMGRRMISDRFLSVESASDSSDNTVIIPELPLGNKLKNGFLEGLESGASAIVGFSGSGFTRLQATLCSYCPAMEHWLRSVAVLVPSSPSLANFLWDPLQTKTSFATSLENEVIGSVTDAPPMPRLNKKSPRRNSKMNRRNSRMSICTLDSINEDLFLEVEDLDDNKATNRSF